MGDEAKEPIGLEHFNSEYEPELIKKQKGSSGGQLQAKLEKNIVSQATDQKASFQPEGATLNSSHIARIHTTPTTITT